MNTVEWVPVSERLPKPLKDVLLVDHFGEMKIGWYVPESAPNAFGYRKPHYFAYDPQHDGWMSTEEAEIRPWRCEFTHWAELPAKPGSHG